VATAISDMQIKLTWQAQPQASHYRLYRGETPDFKPSLRGLVARPSAAEHEDEPQLNYGGWINSRLEPRTTYYYRVAAVDRGNHEGPASTAVAARTLDPKEKNLVPLRVEGLRAIAVSPIAPFNFVNLLFRTSCESDVRTYEIHRSTQPGFQPDEATRIGLVEAAAVIKGSTAYGHVPIDYRAGDYDHLMYEDETVRPQTTYYYRVRAADTAGQKGPFSTEASVRTVTSLSASPVKATASSVYAPEYGPEGAVDGDPDPYAAWISKSYGGGSKQVPRDTWLAIELPRKLRVKGAVYYGDERAVIPLLRNFQIQVRRGQDWITVASVTGATAKVVRVTWPEVVETDAIRFYVAGRDLPANDPAGGVVRVCELKLLLADGTEASLSDLK
jgi:hypothetical protein